MGFPTTKKPEDGIIFFQTGGTCLALYPLDGLAEDVDPELPSARSGFTGITLAHCTKTKEEVDEVLALAVENGGAIAKKPHDTFWGGYSGYFSDPDGYLWEVAYADFWQFKEDGNLVID